MAPHGEVEDGRLWYALHRGSETDRSPLILIHGAGGSHLHWPAELRRIKGRTVLALDLPGHGRSPGPGHDHISGYVASVVSLLDALLIDQAIFCGHSMGGAIALQLALDHRERVAGLIVIGSGAKLRVAPTLLAGVLEDPQATFSLLADWLYGPTTPEQIKRQGTQQMSLVDPAVYHGDLSACDTFDIRDQLAQISCPTLVVGAAEDKMTPLKFSRSLSQGIPNAALEIIQDAGHMMALEQPDRVADAITRFFAGIL